MPQKAQQRTNTHCCPIACEIVLLSCVTDSHAYSHLHMSCQNEVGLQEEVHYPVFSAGFGQTLRICLHLVIWTGNCGLWDQVELHWKTCAYPCVATTVAPDVCVQWGWCVHPLVSLRDVWVCWLCVVAHTRSLVCEVRKVESLSIPPPPLAPSAHFAQFSIN